MNYNKLIFLGTGKLFLDCLSWAHTQELPCIGYDMSDTPQKVTAAQAEKKGLCYQQRSRKEVWTVLRQEEEPTLLLSVINPCIVPEDILKKENIHALNCHQALLPRHKGRNAEAWAIYEGDETAGITWHKMSAEVDAGEILLQKELPITEKTTSFTLFRQQLKAAYEAFLEFMPEVLKGRETYTPQQEIPSDLHLSTEIPANGRLSLSWSGEKMSRFLRATDYGGLAVMERPVVILDGQEYTFRSYSIDRNEGIRENPGVRTEGDDIVIEKDGYQIKLKKCQNGQ